MHRSGRVTPSHDPARRLLLCLVLMSTSLVVAHLLTMPLRLSDPPAYPAFLWSLFSLSAERGIGTWYAVVQLALGAALAWRAGEAGAEADRRTWWRLLAGLLLLASAEEVLGFHEYLDKLIHVPAVAESVSFTWVLLGAPVGLGLALLFARFLIGLPVGVRTLIVAGGALYLVGAVGMEVVGGAFIAGGQASARLISVLGAVEEGLELIGAALVVGGGAMANPTGQQNAVSARPSSSNSAASP